MGDIECLQKIADNINSAYKEYKENEGNYQEIVEAIRKITNGSFIGEYCISTCMGYFRDYDIYGREISADPNYKDSVIMIEGEMYPITRVGWKAYIWKPNSKASYTTCWSELKYKYLLAIVDVMPDYVKEYHKDEKPFVWQDLYLVDGKLYNPNDDSYGELINIKDNAVQVDWVKGNMRTIAHYTI